MRTLMPLQEEAHATRPTLRTDKPVAGYARRSQAYAKDEEKDKSQSREMQTEDLKEWTIMQGWNKKDFHPFFADFGLSGTLAPHERPDMLRLFDEIDAGKFDDGSVACWQENRLFRDETQIYYNQFIQKCKEHNIVVVVVSPYLMIYDFRDDFLTEMFRWKCKESADFIKRHVKGWMLPARHRAAWVDGEWAGLGDPPPGFIVDFAEDSQTFKKLIAYMPHIEKVNEYFQLYMELSGDISLLYGRLRESPIIFPEFEEWVDPRNVKRFKMARYPGGGYYPKGRGTVVSMLTNPIYNGYRAVEGVIRRTSKGDKIREYEPLIEREVFDFAFYRLAKTDLDGNLIDANRPRRFFQQESSGAFGLLKFRVRSNQGEVRTHADGEYSGRGSYHIQTLEQGHSLYNVLYHAAIPCEELDTLIVNRLMEHVHEISRNQEDIRTYEEKASRLRLERQRKIKQINTSITDIDRNQGGLTLSLGSIEAEIKEAKDAKDEEKVRLKQRRKQLIVEQIDLLELERHRLLQAKGELEKEAESDLGSLDDQLRKLEKQWPHLTFEKRRSLLNFILKEVVIDTVATHWLRIQVLWLHEEWGREELFYYRRRGKNTDWTGEEIALVKAHYATMPKFQLMALLPHRGWQAIRSLGNRLKIGRMPGHVPSSEKPMQGLDIFASYSDIEFMQSHGIPPDAQSTNWERLLYGLLTS